MPTVLRIGPYSFLFFSSDQGEPPHIHVKREGDVIKFWLEPIRLAKNKGFAGHEINEIQRLIEKHRDLLATAWYDYFNARD